MSRMSSSIASSLPPWKPENSWKYLLVTSMTVTLVGLALVKGGSRTEHKVVVTVGCLEFMMFGQE